MPTRKMRVPTSGRSSSDRSRRPRNNCDDDSCCCSGQSFASDPGFSSGKETGIRIGRWRECRLWKREHRVGFRCRWKNCSRGKQFCNWPVWTRNRFHHLKLIQLNSLICWLLRSSLFVRLGDRTIKVTPHNIALNECCLSFKNYSYSAIRHAFKNCYSFYISFLQK